MLQMIVEVPSSIDLWLRCCRPVIESHSVEYDILFEVVSKTLRQVQQAREIELVIDLPVEPLRNEIGLALGEGPFLSDRRKTSPPRPNQRYHTLPYEVVLQAPSFLLLAA